MAVKEPIDELAELFAQSSRAYEDAIREMWMAVATDSTRRRIRAVERLAELVGDSMVLADLLGRRRMLLELDEAERQDRGLDGPQIQLASSRDRATARSIVPHVAFNDAVADILEREPRLADPTIAPRFGPKPLQIKGQELYRERNAFPMALTGRVFEIGAGTAGAAKALSDIGDWPRQYGETVWRTNASGAFSAGRMQQAKSEAGRRVIGALEYRVIDDRNLRDNHAMAEGVVAAQDDPVWSVILPPNGYNCRCSTVLRTRSWLRRNGLLDDSGIVIPRFPAGFVPERVPDAGFHGRADAQFYGA